LVGVEGRLQKPGRRTDPRGDPYPEELHICLFHEDGTDFNLPNCRFLKEATISLIELEPSDRLNGDSAPGLIGGEIDSGDDKKGKDLAQEEASTLLGLC